MSQRIDQSSLLLAPGEVPIDQFRPPASTLGRAQQQIEHGLQRFATASGLPPARETPLGTTAICALCGEQVERRETQVTPTCRFALPYWSDCQCKRDAIAKSDQLVQAAVTRTLGSRNEALPDTASAYDISSLARQNVLTFDTFERGRLYVSDGEIHPLDRVREWLQEALRVPIITRYERGPAAALWLVAPPGRGKTHLAIAAAIAAYKRDKRAAALNERKYLRNTLTLPFEHIERLIVGPGEYAWLTVFDDIGKLVPNERELPRYQNAWGAVIDARYNVRRYSIFTSEKTPDEVLEQGSIDLSIYSRIHEMTRGDYILFDGEDSRMRGAA